MQLLKDRYQVIFAGFLCSVILCFFYLRPLDSQWDRMINGDGLGYYAYLPAKFIYHDTSLQFSWFNEVYQKHYAPGTFPNPEDNFLVKYGDRKINKYYPGLSLLWLPFFVCAHLYARISGAATDGFSQPYQISIALASLFYLLLGLIFLRKLILKLFPDLLIGTLIPIL